MMTLTHSKFVAIVTAAAGLFALGCESGGVGDPCTPEDEYIQDFNGFAQSEVNIESKSFQCETRVCIVNHFQGRASCPYGQKEVDLSLPATDPKRCRIPGTDGSTVVDGVNIDEIRVAVEPQIKSRAAVDTVYCSCRCNGPDPNARYCECPSGFECAELVKEIGLGKEQLAGSYCVKAGTVYDPQRATMADVCTYGQSDDKCTATGENPPFDIAAE